MKVAILHYHLRRGGVTRIIELAYAALENRGWDVLIISGEAAPESCRLPAHAVRVVPDLCYDIPASRVEQLLGGVHDAMRAHWGQEADVLHIHNHALGKNLALPLAVSHWAGDGRALLLHIHDFAENGRPQNYRGLLRALGGEAGLSRCLYPMGQRVDYALLNTADLRQLVAAGMVSQCHLLPNPIALPSESETALPSELCAGRLIVYPARGIRRKNLGEVLFWATQAGPGERFVLTLAPQSEADRHIHDDWRSLAERLHLPVIFDAQTRFGLTTLDLIRGADVCLTTSVTEGFGMAFLEPWMAGRPVVGRDLPATDDFRAAGVAFDGLYSRCECPVTPDQARRIAQQTEASVRNSCAAYEVEAKAEWIEQAHAAVGSGGMVDFGRVDESIQRELIETARVQGYPSALPQSTVSVTHNQEIISREYSLDAYGENLVGFYDQLANRSSGPVTHLSASKLLHETLAFDNFCALRG